MSAYDTWPVRPAPILAIAAVAAVAVFAIATSMSGDDESGGRSDLAESDSDPGARVAPRPPLGERPAPVPPARLAPRPPPREGPAPEPVELAESDSEPHASWPSPPEEQAPEPDIAPGEPPLLGASSEEYRQALRSARKALDKQLTEDLALGHAVKTFEPDCDGGPCLFWMEIGRFGGAPLQSREAVKVASDRYTKMFYDALTQGRPQTLNLYTTGPLKDGTFALMLMGNDGPGTYDQGALDARIGERYEGRMPALDEVPEWVFQ